MEKLNYTYIEQLLSRYWDGATTLEEERILKSFFSQNDVPEALQPYAEYFGYLSEEHDVQLSSDFDDRFSDIISEEANREVRVKAVVVSFRKRLMPFLQSAAAIAVTLTIGGAALRGLMSEDDLDYGSNLTSETYVQKEDVKHVIDSAQRNMTAKADSIKSGNAEGELDMQTE